jgi:N-hydroxyarylamine O-acetyltransferase
VAERRPSDAGTGRDGTLAASGKVWATITVETPVRDAHAEPDPEMLDRYLGRLRTALPPTVDARALRELHRAHLVRVAFENLDIHLGRPIGIEIAAVLAKVVTARRGGFCYELNSAFAWLLRQSGVPVDLLQARVYGADGTPGPPFDHLALRVTIDGERHLADVGFGANFVHPLRLDLACPQPDPAGTFELRPVDGDNGGDEAWDLVHDGERVYRLDGRARTIDEFGPMCAFHQTSPESHFTRAPVCTRLTFDGGRVTIAGSSLIVTAPGGERAEHTLDRPSLEAAYAEHFGYAPPLVPAVAS